MFRLFSYFSLCSAVAMAIITTLLVLGYQRHATSMLVATAEKQNEAMAKVISNSIWPTYSGYLTTEREVDGNLLRAKPETGKIHQSLTEIAHGLPVHKVKFYNLIGTTIYSSEMAQIGENKSDNEGFIRASVDQKPASKLSFRDRFSAFSATLYDIDVVESYVPVVSNDGKTMGVFELYYDVTTSVAEISDNRWMIAKVLIGAFVCLYLILLLVVRRAENILKRQYGELQNALVQQERMSILGRITASVSHELRNPLSALRNALYIIRQLSENSEELKPHIEAGERSIARCADIVEDLLEYDKKYKLDREAFDLSSWVAGLVSDQKVPGGVTLETDLQEPGPQVLVDDHRMRRAVTNLVDNAGSSLQARRSPRTHRHLDVI